MRIGERARGTARGAVTSGVRGVGVIEQKTLISTEGGEAAGHQFPLLGIGF